MSDNQRTFDKYSPESVPRDKAEWQRFLNEEFRRIAYMFELILEGNNEIRSTEPEKPRDGALVFADGVAWNPGSGRGFYGRENGLWIKL